MNRVTPLQAVYLFGSHARGQSRADSDVDLCLVAAGAERQLQAAPAFGAALRAVWPRPSFTLVPITPQRLEEKKAIGDFFFGTVLKEGILLAAQDRFDKSGGLALAGGVGLGRNRTQLEHLRSRS